MGETTSVRPRRKRAGLIIALVAVLAIGAGATFFMVRGGSAAADPPPAAAPPPTTEVTRKTLQETITAQGKLGHGAARDLATALSGTITGLPAGGATIGLGHTLFSVDNKPVTLLRGSIPAWREFAAGMDKGPDIKQLEQSLADLGFFGGTPDEKFTAATTTAIKKWQKSLGLEQTGTIALGTIVFEPEDVRVNSVETVLGSMAGGEKPILTITGLGRKITADLKLAQQSIATVGGKVTVNLPDGTKTTGTIASVGTPTSRDGDGGGGGGGGDKASTVIPVEISLDDPAAGENLQEAAVSIDFPTKSAENVLVVPVGALTPDGKDGYLIEVLNSDGTTKKVPVTPGLFAGGSVEISGDGVSEGDQVVIPKL
ncbi:peptidoglycan hydrolase-like protein with peptidoglycan-binding domain [Mycetocola sp. BIGb0189]|uniref:peptidoglycan-binding protein n=1 Tax=Mycetocola sp. BIGb0189 TaxID=2940604 RepID=UPI002169BB75|nr:peptidoglycan-binding protein [Mycetocola sp. BIGb0189]MCS4275652.1 peptidoglycan hydrolase-like protein with peptidoglycan-binding domain [Mycetocola sp. BIGb0189]